MATIDSSQTHEVSGQLQCPCNVGRIVAAIQGIYALVFMLCLAIASLLAVSAPTRFSIGQWACIGLGLEAIALTYLGLRFRKPWVVSLIVFISAYTLIPCATGRPETLLAVVISRAGAVLAVYQLWFFTRPDTRRFFATNGKTVF